MRQIAAAACVLAFALAAGAATDSSEEWPQWRGPKRDGHSPDKGLLKQWPEGGPTLAWKRGGIGEGYASPIVAGGRVFISGKVGNDLVLFAFDTKGSPVWRQVHGSAWTRNYPGSRGTPSYGGGRVYLLSGDGLLKCYDAGTGSTRWEVNIARQFGGRPPNWGYSESPLIYGNAVVVTPGGSNCIVALNAATGAPVWTSTGLSDPVAYSSCIAFTFGGVPTIATMTAKGVVAVRASDGRFLWRNDRAAGRTAPCPTPVYSDGYVFGASGYGNGGACVKLSASGGAVTATQAWETREMDCHHGGFVIVDGFIYGNHKGGWNCLELATGAKRWGDRGVGKGSICYADGMLYTFSERGGNVAISPASPERFSITGRTSVQGRESSWAHPVVVGGRMYLRYSDTLYVFDVRDPSYTPPVSKAPPPKPRPTPRSEPKPTTRTPPKPPPVATPEVKAKRLVNTARNYLLNDMKDIARRKLQEAIDKYPDTAAADEARRMLRTLGR
jgi:outer membrane protein assembly factor BamB